MKLAAKPPTRHENEMRFAKNCSLGKDELVIEPRHTDSSLSAHQAQLICDRHYGIKANLP